MPVRIQMSIEGETQIDRVLGMSAAGVKDFTTPLRQSKEIILARVDQNFNSRGNVFGGWAPRKISKPWPLLEQTGKMRSEFFGDVTSSQLTVGNHDPKFKYHQSNKPRTRLPRRVMLKIDGPSATLITKAFQAYLVGLMRRK